MPLSIDDASGTMFTSFKPSYDNHFSMNQLLRTPASTNTAATASLCGMSANKLEPFIRQSPLEIAFYRMSAMDMIRHQYHPTSTSTPLPPPVPSPSTAAAAAAVAAIDDQYSMSSSSVDSSTSSVSDATVPSLPVPKSSHKKRPYGLLMREIRRLRSENASLHNSVNILKEDLRHERESRQIAEQVHKKYFDDSIDTHTQLEIEILDQQEKILELESRLENTTTTASSSLKPTTTAITDFRSPLVFFGDPFDDIDNNHNNSSEEECPLWGCEDVDCSNERRCYDDTSNDDYFDDDTNTNQQQSIYQHDNNDEDDEDDHNGKDTGDDQFEGLGVSYLRQALMSNLTSARANLEFDDLMLKYDPSPDRVLRTLADAFLGWLRDIIHTSTPPLASPSTNNNDNKTEEQEKATCVARLMTTRVQDVFLHFWKAILERYVHNAEDQYQFLLQAERMLQLHHNQGDDATNQDFQYIVQNFHRLLVMFYKYDIIDGDAVTTWWHNTPALLANNGDATTTMTTTTTTATDRLYQHDVVTDQLRVVTRKFVEWVDDDDDDDDDDDEDDDGDDYDDDDNIVDDYDGTIIDGCHNNELDLDDLEDEKCFEIDNEDPLAAAPPLIPQSQVCSPPEKKKKSVTIQV